MNCQKGVGEVIMKCNIAEFISTIQDGGAETLVKDYMLLLDKSKFNPVVIVLGRRMDTANDKILSNSGVKIVSVYKSCPTNWPFVKRVIRKLNEWWYVPYRLNKILKQEYIDVLHIHLTLLHYVKKISKYIKNIKLLYTCHNEPKLLLSGKRMYENKAARYLIKHDNLQMIALHDDMRREINEMFCIDNTVVIRNGIDFNRFKDVFENKKNIQNALDIPAGAFVVGHVGRFSEQKNHNFLVDVFFELCNRKSNAFLLMIGAGELKQEIENKLNALGLKNKYLILSNRSDIPQLMKAMDVFVFPSLYEGLGIVLIEAQVSEIKCIVSDTVPKEAFKTELVIPLSLNKTAAEWCDAILDDSVKGQPNGDINDYDMNNEIKRLEKLYLGEFYE